MALGSSARRSSKTITPGSMVRTTKRRLLSPTLDRAIERGTHRNLPRSDRLIIIPAEAKTVCCWNAYGLVSRVPDLPAAHGRTSVRLHWVGASEAGLPCFHASAS